MAGLSSAQHHFVPSATLLESLREQWNAEAAATAGDKVKLGSAPRDQAMRKTMWTEVSAWIEDENQPESRFLGGKANRLVRTKLCTEPLLIESHSDAECDPSHFDAHNDTLASHP